MASRHAPLSKSTALNLDLIRTSVRAIRKEQKLSAADVATAAGFHRNTLYQFEIGAAGIGLENLLAALHALGYHLEIVYSGRDLPDYPVRST